MVDALEEVSLKDGDKIIKEGEEGERPRPRPRHHAYVVHPATVSPRLTLQPHTSPGTHFYIIVEGEVVITKAGQKEPLARRTAGDYFGELSLKTGAPTIASVSAAGPTTKLVRMDRGAFQRLLGPLDCCSRCGSTRRAASR